MHLLKSTLKASGKLGVPQGGVISCVLSNLYLNEVDRMLERAKAEQAKALGFHEVIDTSFEKMGSVM
jgi:retron-type reverse transcriptase